MDRSNPCPLCHTPSPVSEAACDDCHAEDLRPLQEPAEPAQADPDCLPPDIYLSHDEQRAAIAAGFEGCILHEGERAIWRSAEGSWVLGPIGEEEAATAFAAGWLDALLSFIQEDATP